MISKLNKLNEKINTTKQQTDQQDHKLENLIKSQEEKLAAIKTEMMTVNNNINELTKQFFSLHSIVSKQKEMLESVLQQMSTTNNFLSTSHNTNNSSLGSTTSQTLPSNKEDFHHSEISKTTNSHSFDYSNSDNE